MPNSLQSSDIASPASRRATNCSLSSIAEHSFQGIITPSPEGESVTYVSGTFCYLCVGSLKRYHTGKLCLKRTVHRQSLCYTVRARLVPVGAALSGSLRFVPIFSLVNCVISGFAAASCGQN